MIQQGLMAVFASPACLVWIFVGTLVGLIFGCIPGLSAPIAVLLFLPMTFGMDTITGISLLIALYVGSTSGGLISAILLKIPGTPASIATVWDGGPMRDKGEAGRALGIGILYSFIGGIISTLALIFVSPFLAQVAMKFSIFEYAAMTFMSLAVIASVCDAPMINSLIGGLLGLFLSFVGMDAFSDVTRFTFGSRQLLSGFSMTSLLIGFFAIAEIFKYALQKQSDQGTVLAAKIKGFGVSWREFREQFGNMIRSALIGIGIGILPGIGGSTSSILSYTVAKNASKHPEKFGTGVIDGVIASETANNATVGGALIPLLTLSIPGSTVCAIMLGGLQSHGVFPGPLIFQKNGELMYAIYAALIVANIAFFLIEYKGINLITRALKVPTYYMLPIVVVMCAIGAFTDNNRVFDVKVIFFFSVVALILNLMRIPSTPLIIGFILGPTLELNFRRAIMYDQGNLAQFFTRPISCVMIIIGCIMLFWPIHQSIKRFFQTRRGHDSTKEA